MATAIDPRRRVTVIDIAKAADVSKSTVSLVLQESPLVKPTTRARVVAAMDELGYIYNRGAANLRRQTSDVIGLVVSDLTNPFFAQLTIGVESVLHDSGYIPLLAHTAESPIRQVAVLRSMREHGAAGLILCPATGTEAETTALLHSWRLPIISVMRRIPETDIAVVAPDNRDGARAATAHLIALGHQRIAYLGGHTDMVVYDDRYRGFRDALAAAGLPVLPELTVEGPVTRQGGRDVLARVLALPEPPTGAVCFNDVVAFGVLYGLAERGLTAGRDFAVVGFDDVTDATQMSPPLTTVAVDSHGLGERAARLVLTQLQAPDAAVADFVGEARLIVRGSCGIDRR